MVTLIICYALYLASAQTNDPLAKAGIGLMELAKMVYGAEEDAVGDGEDVKP